MITPAFAEVNSSLWQDQKSQHFIIYYQDAPAGVVDELVERAEDYYNGIVDNLGFRRMDFWSWDNRARIYLYKNADDFHNETQRANWAGAVVSVDSRAIKTFVGQKFFFDSVLPHEMTHIIFREFVGRKVLLPLWIDEGVACSQEKSSLEARMRLAKKIVLENQYIKLEELSKIYKADNITPDTFYSESASLIIFLISQYGRESFLDFSRNLRDSADWKKSVLSAYHFNGLEEMEQKWKDFMVNQGKAGG